MNSKLSGMGLSENWGPSEEDINAITESLARMGFSERRSQFGCSQIRRCQDVLGQDNNGIPVSVSGRSLFVRVADEDLEKEGVVEGDEAFDPKEFLIENNCLKIHQRRVRLLNRITSTGGALEAVRDRCKDLEAMCIELERLIGGLSSSESKDLFRDKYALAVELIKGLKQLLNRISKGMVKIEREKKKCGFKAKPFKPLEKIVEDYREKSACFVKIAGRIVNAAQV